MYRLILVYYLSVPSNPRYETSSYASRIIYALFDCYHFLFICLKFNWETDTNKINGEFPLGGGILQRYVYANLTLKTLILVMIDGQIKTENKAEGS